MEVPEAWHQGAASRRASVGRRTASRCLDAKIASSSRLDTPVLSKMLVRWCLTVWTLMANWSAISRLLRPAATALTMSRSRGVSPCWRPLETADGWRSAWTRSSTVSSPTINFPATTCRMSSIS
ncbi:MAG: hypothetical protein MZV64_13995 [Ignavibacteriales bacterium]|nr:hypothetical protein [Ignavibacteriales bacterium]